MSAGLGTVTPQQTYLDIGAGNRVFNSLYDGELPPASGRDRRCHAWFEAAVAPGRIGAGRNRTGPAGANGSKQGTVAVVAPWRVRRPVRWDRVDPDGFFGETRAKAGSSGDPTARRRRRPRSSPGAAAPTTW